MDMHAAKLANRKETTEPRATPANFANERQAGLHLNHRSRGETVCDAQELYALVQFSSVQDGIYPLRKAHNYAFHPVSNKFPQRCL